MNNKNEFRRKALKTIGYTNKDASWYVDNNCIPYYREGFDMVLDFENTDNIALAAEIDYLESLVNCVIYAVSEENDGDGTMPYFVFYAANTHKDDLGITNDCGIKTDAIVGFNYEEGWLYKEAVLYCSFKECFEEGNYILELDGGEYYDIIADNRITERDKAMAEYLIKPYIEAGLQSGGEILMVYRNSKGDYTLIKNK